MKDKFAKMFSRSKSPLTKEEREAHREAERLRVRAYAERDVTSYSSNINLR